MSYRRWLVIALCLLAAESALICAVNYLEDPFGVFRDAHGRSLSVYQNERTAKYLLNERYVPENFDGLVIGSSMSANWRTGMIKGARFYNESIDGGNATEERMLVEQAFPAGHFKYAIVVISPFLTRDHQLNEGGMGTPRRREALGSINLLREEMYEILVLTHRQPQEFYPDGSKDLNTPKGNLNISDFPLDAFKIDDIALADYKQLIAELRQRNIKIVFVQPPLYEIDYQTVREDLPRYLQQTQLVEKGDLMIDFNSPAYTSVRSLPANFGDGVHLSRQGAVQLIDGLNREMREIMPAEKRAASG